MAKKMKKGEEGKGTGGGVRKAIRKANKRGISNEKIARSTNRTAATISDIKSGEIKNPPAGLASSINKIKAPKKKAAPKQSTASKRKSPTKRRRK